MNKFFLRKRAGLFDFGIFGKDKPIKYTTDSANIGSDNYIEPKEQDKAFSKSAYILSKFVKPNSTANMLVVSDDDGDLSESAISGAIHTERAPLYTFVVTQLALEELKAARRKRLLLQLNNNSRGRFSYRTFPEHAVVKNAEINGLKLSKLFK